MQQSDLNLYLRMIDKKKTDNEVDVKYQGATDMSKKLDSMAVEAMAKYHDS